MIATFSFLQPLSLLLFLRPALCRPGQCQSNCIPHTNSAEDLAIPLDTEESRTPRIITEGPIINAANYHILCSDHNLEVYALLRQVFFAISQLRTDLREGSEPASPPSILNNTSRFVPSRPPRTPPPSPARAAFLHGVSEDFIEITLRKIVTGSKLDAPAIPPTIDENAELRPGVAKVPGRPHIVCPTPNAAELYDISPDWYDICTKPEYGRPLTYNDYGDTVFLCPRFFTELGIWHDGDEHCPEVSPDGESFAPDVVAEKPVQESFDGWQHLMLFRELVIIYLGDSALTSRSMPRAREDWNECFALEDVRARDNARNWVLWAAAVQQNCRTFPLRFDPIHADELDTFSEAGDALIDELRATNTSLVSTEGTEYLDAAAFWGDAMASSSSRDTPPPQRSASSSGGTLLSSLRTIPFRLAIPESLRQQFQQFSRQQQQEPDPRDVNASASDPSPSDGEPPGRLEPQSPLENPASRLLARAINSAT